jgi:hypothetical protein
MAKINLKIVFFTMLIFSYCGNLNAQSFSDEKVSLSNFIKRMYAATPFEGVKIIDDYNHQYLVSVVSLDKAKYSSPSIMNRVAQVKSQSQANTFLNGSQVTSETIISTTDSMVNDSTKKTVVTVVEKIKENAIGFVNGMELLTNFDNKEATRMVFIFIKEIKKD